MKAYRRINLLCFISLLTMFFSCKKELNSDFDPIVGTWHWYKTKRTYRDAVPASVIWANTNSTSEIFKVEIEKKGLIRFFKNDKVDKKYRIKNFEANFTDSPFPQFKAWVYNLHLNNKTELRLKYYIEGDSLQLWNLFPYYASESQQSEYSYINYFKR